MEFQGAESLDWEADGQPPVRVANNLERVRPILAEELGEGRQDRVWGQISR